MTQSDLRAAAERLQKAGVGGFANQEDLDLVLSSVLASHPPDGETEIDEAWLVSVGFKLNTSTAWGSLFPYTIHNRQWRIAYRPPGSGFDGTWYLGPIGGSTMTTIPPIKTRSDLHHLCAALGIPLKEENG